ncbi:MAG: hypothetical protein QG668_624, partial [Patescibacteria group bacterium]|nr:hypothetical protein [Patescibacteria group bacterium]
KSLLDWLVGIGKIIHDPSIACFISAYPKKQVMCKIEERCSHQRWITTKRDDLSMVAEIIAREMGERVDFLRGETHECPTQDMTQATAWAELKTLAEQTRYLLLALQEMLRIAPSREGQQFLRGVIDSLVRDAQDVTDFIRRYQKA